MQCQIMKPNSVQCVNSAFVSYADVEMCLLHFNWQMESQIKNKIHVVEDQVQLVDPSNEADKATLDKIVKFTNATITESAKA